MPFYEYRCSHCQTVSTIRRSIQEMDLPAACVSDGATLERVFSPTRNIHVPIAFRAVGKGGTEGGNSWSDIHAHTEKELAHIKEIDGRPVEIVPTAEYMSMAGAGGNGKPTVESQEAKVGPVLDKAFKKAWEQQKVVNF